MKITVPSAKRIEAISRTVCVSQHKLKYIPQKTTIIFVTIKRKKEDNWVYNKNGRSYYSARVLNGISRCHGR